MKEFNKARHIAANIFLIVTLLLFLVTTVFFVFLLIDAFSVSNNENAQLQIGVVLILLLIFGSIGYGATLLLSIIGYALSRQKKELVPVEYVKKYKINKTYFIIMILLPIITFIAMFLILNINV